MNVHDKKREKSNDIKRKRESQPSTQCARTR